MLIDQSGKVKVTGFDNCRVIKEDELCYDKIAASTEYQCPELLQNLGYALTDVDQWAVGIIMYWLLAGEPPFKDYSQHLTREKIISGTFNPHPHLSLPARDLFKSLFRLLNTDRPSLDDIEQHQFFRKNLIPSSLPPETAFQKPSRDFLKKYLPPAPKSHGLFSRYMQFSQLPSLKLDRSQTSSI